ncbi:hypothetical protein HRI_003330400 [Hibiscus trionum]|uniref:Uncharacterized protein n=1 Tax=Hibiscus trionum TaxID=183268 RepID=A0A9W7IK88_HIBTR|nr:hypothetical protein HRI_003330400 [Hibiscus trionum]
MASSSSLGSSIPAPEAVQVLVSSLADESPMVREASMASLKEISTLNPLLVLDCCSAVSRGGRRRFGNMAGVFQVMAFGVRALDRNDIDASYIGKLAKIATAEIISSKELNADWQRAAASLLVAIGLHLPDLMMDEIFLHLSGPSSALPAMIQILADFASADALQFTPRLKGVLSRVLPILGNVRDVHRPIFANAFKCWCQAVWQCNIDFPSNSPIDDDVMSFLNSAFELLLRVWAASRDLKVRVSSVDALGQMVGLITRTQLKTALPTLIPTILELYKKDQDIALIATYSLYNLLSVSLLSETGPPLIEFEELTVILSTLLPVICMNNDIKEHSDFSVGLKTYNEVQRCFLTVGSIYPEDLFTFLLNKCRSKEEPLTFSALCVLKHLLQRSSEAWHNKRPLLVDAMKSLLDEQSLGIRKALSEEFTLQPQTESHTPAIGKSFQLRTEVPAMPAYIGPTFAQATIDDLAAGNHAYTLELKKRGILGHFFDPDQIPALPRVVYINVDAYFTGIRNTIFGALKHILKLKTSLTDGEPFTRADTMSTFLAQGCVVITYLKVQAITYSYPFLQNANSLRRPPSSADLPILTPFAFAIQQLGIVKVADLPQEQIVVPAFPETGHKYGLPNNQPWDPNAYLLAYEYARNLGMRFSIVDLKSKAGSAWYLFRQYYANDCFELQCTIPEVNFTDSMVVAHTLFLSDENDPTNVIFNLADFGTTHYGMMVINPHRGINLSSFEAFSDT